jgi:hypothetical protein
MDHGTSLHGSHRLSKKDGCLAAQDNKKMISSREEDIEDHQWNHSSRDNNAFLKMNSVTDLVQKLSYPFTSLLIHKNMHFWHSENGKVIFDAKKMKTSFTNLLNSSPLNPYLAYFILFSIKDYSLQTC